MPGSDLDLLRNAAMEAGKISMHYFGQSPEVWDKGGGLGPVCEADLAIDKMLQAEFASARPNYGILSEETEDDHARLNTEHTFIIDPIDGTRSFINHHENFSNALAIAKDGVVTAAVVNLPAKGLLYEACLGNGAFLNGKKIECKGQSVVRGARVLASGSQTRGDIWRDGPPPFERHFRSSLAYRLCLVAAGRFDAMITLRPTFEWDVAAGSLICTEAGSAVVTQDNATPLFNQKHPCLNGMVAGNEKLKDAILSYL